jgi:hypothetical protein
MNDGRIGNSKKGGDVMSQPTLDDVRQYANELEAKFSADESVAYANVSYTQLSIARYYGGCNVSGKYFIYNANEDSLIREDVMKWIVKRKKQEAKK